MIAICLIYQNSLLKLLIVREISVYYHGILGWYYLLLDQYVKVFEIRQIRVHY